MYLCVTGFGVFADVIVLSFVQNSVVIHEIRCQKGGQHPSLVHIFKQVPPELCGLAQFY